MKRCRDCKHFKVSGCLVFIWDIDGRCDISGDYVYADDDCNIEKA